MDLKQLSMFVTVARTGGFAAAAAVLDIGPSTVTRAIARLEESLGARLFHRTTRSVTLTEAGQQFLAQVEPSLESLDAAAESVRPGSAALSGTLRISASTSFGQRVLAPVLSLFCKEHEGLTVDLVLSDSLIDVVGERIDVAIRHGVLRDSSLVAQKLMPVSYRLVASPEYLAINNPIRSPRDIVEHTCLTYPYEAFRCAWRFEKAQATQTIPLAAKLTVSNALALNECAKSGLGLALLADWVVDQEIARGDLAAVLPEWTVSGGGVDEHPALWVVTPSRAYTPEKARSFIQFFKNHI